MRDRQFHPPPATDRPEETSRRGSRPRQTPGMGAAPGAMGEATTRNLAMVLQMTAALATMGMYFRLMSDLHLPFIFMFLPVSLLVLPLVTRLTWLLDDPATRDTVTGVLTGVTCSFPVVVTNVQQVEMRAMAPWNERYVPPGAALLRSCELLFVPLLLATILLSFAKSIERFPSSIGLATAAATAFSADFSIMTCYVMLRAEDTRGSDVIATLLLLLIPFFLFCLMPLFRDKQRAWLLTLIILIVLVFWQVIFAGSSLCIWSTTRKTFPVPACLLGVVFVFHSAYLDWDRLKALEKRDYSSISPVKSSHHEEKDHKLAIHPLDAPWQGLLSNGLLWHCLAYCVERLALAKTFPAARHSQVAWYEVDLSDLVILGLFAVSMSSYIHGSRTVRIVIVGLLMFIDTSFLMAFHLFLNTHFLEVLLGLALVCVTDPYPIEYQFILR